MHLQPYTLDELRFAYCCHVYYRWHTYYRRPLPTLRALTKEHLMAEHPEVHILNFDASDQELVLLASIRPSDSVSSVASKLKGATSKTLRRLMNLDRSEKLLGGGYFACTTGANTAADIDRYLENQSQHHGYDRSVNPPVWTHTWPTESADEFALQAHHSFTRLRWHIVLSTWNRNGTFTRAAAEAVTRHWETLVDSQGIEFLKVSWVADHVHVAIRSHPAVVPEKMVLVLLNASQELMAERFESLLIHTGNPRLWKPGGYVGTYGDLANTEIQAYLRRWRREQGLDGKSSAL
jgi:REP element-mobilizing transposase RayT